MKNKQENATAFGSFGPAVQFADFRDLYHKVHAIIPTLKLNVLERENAAREGYTVLYYALHECSALRFPLPLKIRHNHPSNPDFILYMSDGSEVGVEITEATTEERQVGLKLQASTKTEQTTAEESVTSINSGLVGTGVAIAEKESRRKWVEIVAGRIRDKISKATKYNFTHPLHLVVYSNTGYDFENVKTAVEELRTQLSDGRPFERISILLGGRYLVGDILGDWYQHECYSEFDEIENAIDYLERTGDFLAEPGPLHNWKWVWISLYEALYSFLIGTIKGTDPDRVMQAVECKNSSCRQKCWPGTLRDNNLKCPKCGQGLEDVYREELISFDVTLERAQDSTWMLQYVMSELLNLTQVEKDAIKKLKYVGEGLLRFIPKSWAIQVPGRDALILSVIGIIERIVSGKHNIFLDNLRKARISAAITLIRSQLEKPFGLDYVSS